MDMLALIVMIIFGMLLTFFALENTNGVTMTVMNYTLQNVPLYAVVVGSVLFGLFVGWIMSLMDWVSTSLTLKGKESSIKSAQTAIDRLENKIHDLEIENARLKGEHNEPLVVEEKISQEEYHPGFFDRLFRRHRLA
jgi:uncharacterized integral membrane protein